MNKKDIENFKKAADEGRADDFINNNLSPDSAKKLRKILSDKAACDKLLSTPEARELMKKLLKQ